MRIVIVGGGTAGWLTAAYLSRNIPRIQVTVVDKEFGTPIGVGEGTVLDFYEFMKACKFDFTDWFTNIDATFKAGIVFKNWQHSGSEIWHPFFSNLRLGDLNADIWELLAYRNDLDYKDYACMLFDSAVRNNKVDQHDSGLYAFHIDAGKLVTYIQDRCKDVEIIKKEVVKVNRGSQDEITSLELIDSSLISGDLYIDCTGFRSLLKKQKRIDISDRLFCDTAVAGRIPYENKSEEVRPYVICDAVEHGWIWRIPVKSRLGSGLVFNRSVTDPEDAKDYLVKYWNNRLDKDSLRVIDWSPFYIENFWENNVISIGLSGGFVEPLESTGISLIIQGIKELESRLRLGYYSETDTKLYNSIMSNYFENIINFVNMHYSNSTVSGPFWDFVRDKFKTTDLQLFMEKLITDHKFRYSVPRKYEPNSFTMFQTPNWVCLLNQYGLKFSNDGDSEKTRVASYALENFYKEEQTRKLRAVSHLDLIEYYHSGGK